jgi:hypothetical protein
MPLGKTRNVALCAMILAVVMALYSPVIALQIESQAV